MCVGTLILVFGRKVPPKHLIILFMAIAFGRQHAQRRLLLLADAAGGAFHFRPAAWRVLRHGHADRQKTLADKGKEAQSVSMMVMGQTVANMLGVPAGTLLAEAMSWRLAFAILAAWAL